MELIISASEVKVIIEQHLKDKGYVLFPAEQTRYEHVHFIQHYDKQDKLTSYAFQAFVEMP